MPPAATARARRVSRAGPRARSGRRPVRRSGIRWDRVGRAALLGTLGIVLLLYVSPLHRWLTQRHTAAVQQSELGDLQQQNRALRSRIRTLRRPAALELEARKLGMVRRGERAFVIENPPKR